MSSKRIWCTILSLSLGLGLGMNTAVCSPIPAIITADPTGGKSKTQVCASCHGETGNGVPDMPDQPKLAGQHQKYLTQQMRDFKQGAAGLRPNGIMLGFMQNLSDQDLQDIAAYYAAQTATVGTVPAAFLALGQQIYRGGILKKNIPACAACHGSTGGGNALMNAPALSGQNPNYIIAQMQAFKIDARKNDPNAMMRDIAKKMSDEEVQAIAHYIFGLH
jgi:cytochrome c553